jgi:mannitol-1-/sugar-/sorbitol-6-phosphatase
MTHIACSALLFDMDGVLIDSTPAVARVWAAWALEHGFEPDEVVGRAHGRPSISTVRDYLPNLPKADQEAENRAIEQREIEDMEGVVPLPGALELLNSLPQERWAIVTSCTRPLAEARLTAAGLPRPRIFVTSTDIVHGKPAPDPYLKGAEMLGFRSNQCVVVEDAPAGIRSGKSADCRVIGLRTMMTDDELRAVGADWLLDNCSGIKLDSVVSHQGEISLVLFSAPARASVGSPACECRA